MISVRRKPFSGRINFSMGEKGMNSFPFKNLQVRFITAGEGEPFLFLHNGSNDHRIWDHQIAHFSPRYRVYALDLPGYGQSDGGEIGRAHV